jgi:hypothetical protein
MKRTSGYPLLCLVLALSAQLVAAREQTEQRCLGAHCVSGWYPVDTPNGGGNISALAAPSPQLVIAGNDSGIWSSNFNYMGGKINWQHLSNTVVTCLAADSMGTMVFAGTSGKGLFKIRQSIKTSTGLKDMFVKALVRNSRGFLYVVSSPTLNGDYRVSCSFDSGTTWIPIGKPAAVPPVLLTSLAVDQNDFLFAGTDKGVFRYIGGYWDSVNTGTVRLPDSQVTALGIGYNSYVYLGTNHGLFYSVDAGKSWSTLIGFGLPNHIKSLATGPQGPFMPAVGTDSGLFAYAMTVSVMPEAWRISAAYSDGRSVTFNIDRKEFVDLRLYDAGGTERARLTHGELAPGTHNARICGLPDGIYFFRLRIGSAPAQSGKIMVCAH